MKMRNATVIMLVVCLAMTAPTWGASNWVGGSGNLWNTAANWNPAAVPSGGSVDINGSFSVEVNAPSFGGFTKIYNGAHLTINANLTLGDDLVIKNGVGSTVTMNAGTLDIPDEKLKLGESGDGNFFMKGGTVHVDNDVEMFAGSVLEFSGGSWTSGTDGSPLEFEGGTIRVIGNDATLISLNKVDKTGAGSTFEFIPNAAGLITPITSGDTKPALIKVNLDALTAPSVMTLIQGGFSEAFPNVAVTKDGIPLTLGTEGSLNPGEYFLAGATAGAADVVLSVNVAPDPTDPIPEPATMALLGLAVCGLGGYVRRRRRA